MKKETDSVRLSRSMIQDKLFQLLRRPHHRGSTDDPCSLFRNINFPVGEFFPPNTVALPEDYEEAKNFCACCHK